MPAPASHAANCRILQRLLIAVNLGVAVQYAAEAIVFHNRLPSGVDSVEGFLIWLYIGLGVFALAAILTLPAGGAMKRTGKLPAGNLATAHKPS